MTAPLSVGIAGSTSLLGESLKNRIKYSGIAVSEVRLFASGGETNGQVTDFNDEARVITALDEINTDGIDVLFFCSDDSGFDNFVNSGDKRACLPVAVNLAPRASDSIGSSLFNSFTDRIEPGKKAYEIFHPAVVLSQMMLDPLIEFGIESAAAFALQPVSYFGKGGIEELHDQTVNLLNFQEAPVENTRIQSSFNVFSAQFLNGKGNSLKKKLDEQMKTIREYPLSMAVVQVPLFHAASCFVWLKTEKDVPVRKICAAITERHGKLVSLAGAGKDTSALNSADPDVFHLGHIWKDGNRERTYWLWGTADDTMFCAGLNAVGFLKFFSGHRSSGNAS